MHIVLVGKEADNGRISRLCFLMVDPEYLAER